MTVDQEIAKPLLKPSEIAQIESFSNEVPRTSVDTDSYHVILLRYAERIMFSPLLNGVATHEVESGSDLSDRASEELTKIRQELERISKPIH